MAIDSDALRLREFLGPLANSVLAAAKETLNGEGPFVAVTLDVRYSADGKSFNNKCRVELADGTRISISLPLAVTMQLITLGDSRPQGKDCWYVLLLRVSAEGQCQTKLNYDADCEEDPDFYRS